MKEETYYVKKGKKYVPVYQFDEQLMNSFPVGSHLVTVSEGMNSRRYRIDPNHAGVLAAAIIAETEVVKKIREASESRPQRNPLTEKQVTAWKKLAESFGEELCYLSQPSAYDVYNAMVSTVQNKLDELLKNEGVKRAFDHFMLMAKLAENTAE